MAPVFTAFTESGSVDCSIIPAYAKFLAESNITGILVNGTSGEGMSLNVNERKQVTEAWINSTEVHKQHVMVQVGGAPLPDVLELAKHAESIGADSILCLPDLYFKPTKPKDLVQYFKTISRAAPKTPLLYYHIPMFTQVNIHMGEFLNEMADQIPTFAGIKFTSNNLDEGVAALKAHQSKFAVFLGADTLMAGAFSLGFDSAIATSLNILPHLGENILKAIQNSDVKRARIYQDNLTEFCNHVTKDGGGWVPTMKVAMNLFSNIKVGNVREPLQNLSDEEVNKMKKMPKILN